LDELLNVPLWRASSISGTVRRAARIMVQTRVERRL
jgi:hypothetical protein